MKNTTRARLGLRPAYPWRLYHSSTTPGTLQKYYASVHYDGRGQWRTRRYSLEDQPGGWRMYMEAASKTYRSLKAAKQAAREWCK